MGIFEFFFGGGGSNNSSGSKNNGSGRNRNNGLRVGKLYKGTVTSIEDEGGYFFVRSKGSDVFIHISEISHKHVDTISDNINEGDKIDFVTIEKNGQGWKGSIKACQEYRKREVLSNIDVGEILNEESVSIVGRDRSNHLIIEFDEYKVKVPEGDFPIWLQNSDLSEINEYLKEGELKVQITNKKIPDDWKNSNSYAIGSLISLSLKDDEETLEIITHLFPFCIKVVAKRPRELDRVMEFILRELLRGSTRKEIQIGTGFSDNTLKNIIQKLKKLGYVKAWELTERGRNFVKILLEEEDLNEDPIKGYFAGNAHPSSEIIDYNHSFKELEYNSNKNKAAKGWASWNAFLSKTDGDIPFSSISKVIPDDKLEMLKEIQTNDNFHLFIQRLSKPESYVELDTPVEWFFRGLNKAFNPINDEVPVIEHQSSYCSNYLLIKFKGIIEKEGADIDNSENNDIRTRQEWVYYEPNTESLWISRNDNFKEKKIRGNNFPKVSISEELKIEDGEILKTLKNPVYTLIKVN